MKQKKTEIWSRNPSHSEICFLDAQKVLQKNPRELFPTGPLVSLVGGKQVGEDFLHSFIAILPHYGNEGEAGGR